MAPATQKSLTIEHREEVIARLGGKCQNPDCQWINVDGTRGCTDIRCLQVEYKTPTASRYRGWDKYSKMLKDPKFDENYQIVCANCNWIKRADEGVARPSQRETRFTEEKGWEIKIGGLWVPFQRHGKEAL